MSQSPEHFHENFKTPHVIITCIYCILSYTVVTPLICLISYRALYLAQSTDILCPIESEGLEDLP